MHFSSTIYGIHYAEAHTGSFREARAERSCIQSNRRKYDHDGNVYYCSIVSSNGPLYGDDHRRRVCTVLYRGLKHTLLVYVTQETTCGVHDVSDGDFRKQPIRRYRRVQLGEQMRL
jgi:hypothetical protein